MGDGPLAALLLWFMFMAAALDGACLTRTAVVGYYAVQRWRGARGDSGEAFCSEDSGGEGETAKG